MLWLAESRAAFDPARIVPEPAAIAQQFSDPAEPPATPAFADSRTGFTTHAEVFAFLDRLAAQSPRLALETIGRSQQGRALAMAVLTGTGGYSAARPTVLVLGQQHGNEPAGGEAALALVRQLALERAALLERVNVLIVPRANPDGAEHFVRTTASGLDVNRDHLLLRTPEAQAIEGAVRRYGPQVVLDLHEFTVAGRWTSKFGGVMRADALLQAATTVNLSPAVAALQARYLDGARAALEQAGLRTADYHTTTADAADKAVYMGGINVDTGRNVGGLRNAVSILIETRGVGLGRQHFARRVDTHVIQTERSRARPCGYLIDGSEARALALLRELGVRIEPASRRRPLRMERYVVDAESSGKRQDGRGAIDDGEGDGVRFVRVHTEPLRAVPASGTWFVTMRQPLAALVSAALEPDSQSSLVANRLLEVRDGHLLRVVDAMPGTARGLDGSQGNRRPRR